MACIAFYSLSESISIGRNCLVLQVNVTNRDAALSPPLSDDLSAFAGQYTTYILPAQSGNPATKTWNLTIQADGANGEEAKFFPTN